MAETVSVPDCFLSDFFRIIISSAGLCIYWQMRVCVQPIKTSTNRSRSGRDAVAAICYASLCRVFLGHPFGRSSSSLGQADLRRERITRSHDIREQCLSVWRYFISMHRYLPLLFTTSCEHTSPSLGRAPPSSPLTSARRLSVVSSEVQAEADYVMWLNTSDEGCFRASTRSRRDGAWWKRRSFV